jgi:hypothetical protein
MQVSQELLNQCDELKSLTSKCLVHADAAERLDIHRIIMPLYAVSCGALVVTINQLAGSKRKSIVIETDGIAKLFNDIDTKEYCTYTIANLRQFHAWVHVNVTPQVQTKIQKLAHHIYDALDEANGKLHVLLKKRLKTNTVN